MATFHIHLDKMEYHGSYCPFVGVIAGRDADRLCNLWTITHPGTVMACDGHHPPDACPVGKNTIAIAMDNSKIDLLKTLEGSN